MLVRTKLLSQLARSQHCCVLIWTRRWQRFFLIQGWGISLCWHTDRRVPCWYAEECWSIEWRWKFKTRWEQVFMSPTHISIRTAFILKPTNIFFTPLNCDKGADGIVLEDFSLLTLVYSRILASPCSLQHIWGLEVACLLIAVFRAWSDSMPYHLVPCEEGTPHNHLQRSSRISLNQINT
jgi:hypothetical protein